MRRRLQAAVAVAVAGALLVLVAAGRTWGSATASGSSSQHLTVTGARIAPGLNALAIALLALAVAAYAASSVLRRLAGFLGVVVAGATLAVVVRGHGRVGDELRAKAFGVRPGAVVTHANAWWIPALTGAVLAVLAFATVAVVGDRWRGMSARYDAPASTRRSADPAVATWDALDRGDDPTD